MRYNLPDTIVPGTCTDTHNSMHTNIVCIQIFSSPRIRYLACVWCTAYGTICIHVFLCSAGVGRAGWLRWVTARLCGEIGYGDMHTRFPRMAMGRNPIVVRPLHWYCGGWYSRTPGEYQLREAHMHMHTRTHTTRSTGTCALALIAQPAERLQPHGGLPCATLRSRKPDLGVSVCVCVCVCVCGLYLQ